MSITPPDINLSTSTSPIQIIPPSNLQANQIGWIEFLNESPYSGTLIAGGVQVPIPPWDDYPMQISRNGQVLNGFNLPIFFSFNLLSIQPGTLSTTLRVCFYSPGEVPPSTSPRQLVRQTFIPNPVSTVSGTSTSVQDDLRPAGNATLEATVIGDGASSASITNNGIMTLGSGIRAGQLNINSSLGSPIVWVDANSNLNVGLGAHINANGVTSQANQDLALSVPTGHKIIDAVNGTNTFSVDGNGANLLSGTLKYLVGSLSRMQVIKASPLINGKVTVSHSLGVVPTSVLIVPNVSSVPTGGPPGYNPATITSTTVDIWASGNFNADIFLFAS